MAVAFTSCDDYETYSDKKAKERSAISSFIAAEGINVISEATFNAQNQTTDTARNEFVLLQRTGVYMQIVRKGCGSKLEENKVVTLLCRFMEKNIQTDSIMIRNDQRAYVYSSTLGQYMDTSQYVDKLSVQRTGTTITASFVEGMMKYLHGAQVPSGWMVPLNYVNVGRPETVADETSKVRLIVPHSQGTSDAQYSVFPCYYELTFERE
ncbi:MAG: DUF4827 domain-containing protein [Prevotella sp.]|nr:DUF4827 domain-containing protein [Prevotella sp.]